ncbi:hypothetical protein TELCIR_04370 [Teladorsagia circumcincta]|uniref:Uncharacterized protein n=1 Tax=Teladorsagia circumcincta TaxID=45464 RepID=A0A2G9UTT6_TELCI|nr:hypothetical protein TELCIR_04370 [Teladorsagia circumcincta]
MHDAGRDVKNGDQRMGDKAEEMKDHQAKQPFIEGGY